MLSSKKETLAFFTILFVITDIVVVCSLARLRFTDISDQTMTKKERDSARLYFTKSYHVVLMERLRLNPRYIRSDCQMEEPVTELSEKDSPEFGTVKDNLDKCLRTSELMEYFHKEGLYHTAVRNAAHLLSTVRSVVPQNVSRNFSIPCWRAHLEVNLVSKSVVGSINGRAFASPTHCWNLPAQRALHSGYYQNKSSELVCLPNIFLAGFPKCGSTYMYCLLRRISYLAYLSGRRAEIEKEPRMWVSTGPDSNHQYPHQLNDLTHYLYNFMPAVDTVLKSQHSLAIDASPNLLFQWPRYRPREFMENYCLLPAVLPQILPNNKYIVVMREPASMLYSAFWFSCVTLNVTLTRQQQVDAPNVFHMEVVEAIETFQWCTEHYPTDKCIDDAFHSMKLRLLETQVQNSSARSCLRLRFETGFYYNYIRRWLAIVPRTQFLFLTTEELNRSPPYKDIVEFLGIDEFGVSSGPTNDDMKCETNKSKFNYRSDPALWMRNDTKKLLNDFFAPFNEKLANLLGDNKFLWKN